MVRRHRLDAPGMALYHARFKFFRGAKPKGTAMSVIVRAAFQRCFSVAVSICLIATIAGRAQAGGGLPFDVAAEVMITDIHSQMLIASAESGTGAVISTSNGQTTLTPGGDQFSISFTAGSVVVSDLATFTSSGGAPGTGTWTIATTAGSTFTDTGTATVTS
jgi:hypothetical protein